MAQLTWDRTDMRSTKYEDGVEIYHGSTVLGPDSLGGGFVVAGSKTGRSESSLVCGYVWLLHMGGCCDYSRTQASDSSLLQGWPSNITRPDVLLNRRIGSA